MARREGFDVFKQIAAGRERAERELRALKERAEREVASVQRKAVQGVKQKIASNKALSDYLATPEGRRAAGSVGLATGIVKGVADGAVDMAQGIADTAVLGVKVLNPAEAYNPNGARAQLGRQFIDAARGVADGIQKIIKDPAVVEQKIKSVAKQAYVDLVPTATPAAGTWEEEFGRNLEIGENQGELAFNVGSSFAGAPAIRGVSLIGKGSKLAGPAKYMAEGFTPKQAAYLAEPYEGLGQHVIPQRGVRVGTKPNGRPKYQKLPEFVTENSFNVLKPKGIERGEMYRRHAEVDSKFHGARFPDHIGGAWSRRKTGTVAYKTNVGRVFYGLPTKSLSILGAAPTATLIGVLENEGQL